MTIQEIRDLVAKKIAGQGTMVDVGGGLPAILDGILDAIAEIPTPVEPNVITVPNNTDFRQPLNSGAILASLRKAVADGVIMNTIVMTEDKTKQAKIITYGPKQMPGESFFVHAWASSESTAQLVLTSDD